MRSARSTEQHALSWVAVRARALAAKRTEGALTLHLLRSSEVSARSPGSCAVASPRYPPNVDSIWGIHGSSVQRLHF